MRVHVVLRLRILLVVMSLNRSSLVHVGFCTDVLDFVLEILLIVCSTIYDLTEISAVVVGPIHVSLSQSRILEGLCLDDVVSRFVSVGTEITRSMPLMMLIRSIVVLVSRYKLSGSAVFITTILVPAARVIILILVS